MKLELSEDQRSLRDAIARLASDHAPANGSADPGPAFWAAFKEAGWLALPFPEDRGGVGGTLTSCGIVLEKMGRHGLVTPFLSGWVAAGPLLARASAAAERQDLFDSLIAGDASIALAHGEYGQFHPRRIRTVATPEGEGWRIVGSKPTVLGGAEATQFVVTASTSAGELLLALLPSDTDGLRIRRFHTWRGEDAADLDIVSRITPDQILARGDTASALLNQTLREAAVAACWEAVGMMRALLDDTIAHVQTRHQFGKSMSALQVVRHRVAEMFVYYEEARALVRGATLQLERGGGDRFASAKAKVVEATRYVSRQAVQLQGGMGVTDESRVASLFRKLMAFESLYGSSSEHLRCYGNAIIESRCHLASAVLP